MAFSYSAGSATPGFGGLAELTTLAGVSLLRINVATLKPLSIPPLNLTMPLRAKSTPVPRGGSFADPPLPDEWAFDLTGNLDPGTNPDDVQAAIDYIRAKVNAWQGFMLLLLNAKGWTGSPATRQMTVQVNGQVGAVDVEVERKKVPRRGFVIPLLAPDPRIYSSAQTTTVITTATNVTNAGTTPAPFTARFHGPQTDPILNGPGTGNIIGYTGAIASGHYVDVNTVDSATGTMTALLDGTTDAFPSIDADSANYLDPGTHAWSATNTTGAGATEILSRDAYG